RPGAWRMLGIAWLAYAYFGLGAYSSASVLTRMQEDLGFSATAAGVLLATLPIAYVVGAGTAGVLNDAIGSRRAVALGIVAMSLSTVVMATAASVRGLIAGGLVFGVGGSIISTGTPKVVGDRFSEGRERTKAS